MADRAPVRVMDAWSVARALPREGQEIGDLHLGVGAGSLWQVIFRMAHADAMAYARQILDFETARGESGDESPRGEKRARGQGRTGR